MDLAALLDDLRAQRERMLAYMSTHRHPISGLPGMPSYRLVHAFVETLELLHAGDAPGARFSMRQWEAWAHKLLDAQLFQSVPNDVAVSMEHEGAVVRGVDGCTLTLSNMIAEQRAIMEACIAQNARVKTATPAARQRPTATQKPCAAWLA